MILDKNQRYYFDNASDLMDRFKIRMNSDHLHRFESKFGFGKGNWFTVKSWYSMPLGMGTFIMYYVKMESQEGIVDEIAFPKDLVELIKKDNTSTGDYLFVKMTTNHIMSDAERAVINYFSRPENYGRSRTLTICPQLKMIYMNLEGVGEFLVSKYFFERYFIPVNQYEEVNREIPVVPDMLRKRVERKPVLTLDIYTDDDRINAIETLKNMKVN